MKRQPFGESRRGFVRGIAASAAIASASSVFPACANTPASSRFKRLFPYLPPFADASPQMTAALLDIGRPGGILDANDNLAAGPTALIVDQGAQRQQPQRGNAGGRRRHHFHWPIHRP